MVQMVNFWWLFFISIKNKIITGEKSHWREWIYISGKSFLINNLHTHRVFKNPFPSLYVSMIIFPITGASETKELVQNSTKKSGQPILIKFTGPELTQTQALAQGTDVILGLHCFPSLHELPHQQKEAGHAPLSQRHLSPTDSLLKKSQRMPFTKPTSPSPTDRQDGSCQALPSAPGLPYGRLKYLMQGHSHKEWLGNS